jgi:hypothetical protein
MDEQLLDALGVTAANRRAFASAEDRRWQALAEGRADAAEAAAAKAEDPERWDAYRPFDAAAAEAVHQRVAEALERRSVASPARNVISLADRRAGMWRRLAMVAVPLAAAAALVLMLRPFDGPALAPLPSYALEIAGAEALVRGAESAPGPEVFTPQSSLVVVLRPASAAPGDLALRAWQRHSGGAWQIWEPKVEWSADGAARIAGSAGALLGETPGLVDLRVVVGRKGELPSTAEAAEAPRSGEPTWQRVDARVLLESAR